MQPSRSTRLTFILALLLLAAAAPTPMADGFTPYIVAIPGAGRNNTTLSVSVAGLGPRAKPVYISADQGPTSHKHSYSMAYDSTDQTYRYTFDSFFATPQDVAGSIEITTTGGVSTTLSSGQRHYERWVVLRDEATRLNTQDGALTLSLDPATLPASLSYILVVETLAPVDAPAGMRSVSVAYSLSASGSINRTDRPYLFILGYQDEWLGSQDPATLRLYWFDPLTDAWVVQATAIHPERREVVLATQQLGTFMLFTPRPQAALYLPLVQSNQ